MVHASRVFGAEHPLLSRRPLLHPRGNLKQGFIRYRARHHNHKTRTYPQFMGLATSGRLVADADAGEQAVREFVEPGLQAGRVSDGFTNVPDALARLGIVAPERTITNAAAVAFCEAPGACLRMKLGLLAGNDKLDILDLRQEFLPLIPLLRLAELFVVSNIRRRFVFGEPGMKRREVTEIPREAARQAIANALCHRDYETGTSVQVNVYMDFVEIVSLGLFPEGYSPDRHPQGNRAATSSSASPTSRRCSSDRA